MAQLRRKSLTRIAARVALALIVLDLLAYAGLDRSLAGLLAQEQQRFTLTRLQWQSAKARLAYLEKRDAALPVADRQLQAFLERHVPPRREGFSRAAILVQQLTQESSVELSGISYKLDKSKTEPFEHLSLRVYVQGPFPSLLGFAHALETASDFIVVRSFKFENASGSMLGLRLAADLYLMP